MVWSQRVLIKIYERASRISSYISLPMSLPPIPPPTSPLFHHLLLIRRLSRRERTLFFRSPLSRIRHRARIRGIRNEPASREFTRLGIGPSIYFTLGSLGAVPRILGREGPRFHLSCLKSDSRLKLIARITRGSIGDIRQPPSFSSFEMV